MAAYPIAKKHVSGSALASSGLTNANVMCSKKSGATWAEIIRYVIGRRTHVV